MKVKVETERLILREFHANDLEGLYALDSDPEVHRYLGNKPVSDRQTLKEVIRYIQSQYADFGIGRWAVIRKEDQAFLGWCGLKFNTELTNGHRNFYDLGYRFIRRFWAKGYAMESAAASLQYVLEEMKLVDVYASAHNHNTGSNRILQKLEFQWKGNYKYENEEMNWYHKDLKKERNRLGRGGAKE